MDFKKNKKLKKAYLYCETLARKHYENFPVASLLLPARLRKPIIVIYAFARTADDIADEGSLSIEERLHQLQTYQHYLEIIQYFSERFKNTTIEDIEMNVKPLQDLVPDFENPIFIALLEVVIQYQLPMAPFFDLLQAFSQDVTHQSYPNFEELLKYCDKSASPIGRLLLYLTQNATEQNIKESDSICTGLQLLNFIQDLSQDLQFRQRCYLPQDEMKLLSISQEELLNFQHSNNIDVLIHKQLQRTILFFEAGRPLIVRFKGRLRFELEFIVACSLKVAKLLQERKSIYTHIKLSAWSMLQIFIRTLIKTLLN